MKKFFLAALILIALVSCASKPTMLSKEGRKVKITSKSQVRHCDLVGKVYGKDDSGSEEIAKIDLKNAAADMDIDSVVIKETIQNGKIFVIHAMGYVCNKED